MKKITNKVLFLIGATVALQPAQSQALDIASLGKNAAILAGAGFAGYYIPQVAEGFMKQSGALTADLKNNDNNKNITKANVDRDAFREGLIFGKLLPGTALVVKHFDYMHSFGEFVLGNLFNTKRALNNLDLEKMSLKTVAYAAAGAIQAIVPELVKAYVKSLEKCDNKLTAGLLGLTASWWLRKDLNTVLQMCCYREADKFDKFEMDNNQAVKDLVATGLSLSKLGYEAYTGN